MRKLVLTMVSFALIIGIGQAQDDLSDLTGKKALKQAARLLTSYNLDQNNNGDKILEAKAVIEHAAKQDDVKADPKTWATMGNIYNALSNHDLLMKVKDATYTPKHLNAGTMAFQAFKKCLEIDPGNKIAIEGLSISVSSISNSGMASYEASDYMGAFNDFRAVLEVHELLKANEAPSPLDTEEDLNNQKYVTGLAALNAGQTGTAKSYFQELYDKNYDKSAVYDAMYRITAEEDMDAAAEILSKGRERFPDDTGLLFTEINHYLKLGKILELEEKLKYAIEKEPENASLYSTLGNTYERLNQNAVKEGNMAEEQRYFDLAKEYYEKALTKKSDYTDAIYSIGALYYNKAAAKSQEMNELSSDLSKEATQKYDKLHIEVESLFDQALPYFKDVEKIDPNDRNTLIALKEIFARKNQFDLSNEFKDRLERLEAGEKIENSYFQ